MVSFKEVGDQAFKQGRLEDAHAAYAHAVDSGVVDASLWCNKSLAALKLGHAAVALADAEQALEALSQSAQCADVCLAAKAVHRKAQAEAALGRPVDSVKTYRRGLVAYNGAPQLQAALRQLLDRLPVQWLAQYWSRVILDAQVLHPLSMRDGVLLKPVPAEQRLDPEQLQSNLAAALIARPQCEARDLACKVWAQGRKPGRAEAAYFRGLAYLQAGNAQQAEKDVRVALVYGPSLAKKAVGSHIQEGAMPHDISCTHSSCWPAAMRLHAAALEAAGNNLSAALLAWRAQHLEPNCPEDATALERLLRRIPEEYASVLQSRGADALEAVLAAEQERSRPEFLRQRPKYYYYYQWMRRRLAERHPSLPAPVVDKLLTMDANELDLLLQYPVATDATVARVSLAFEQGGEEGLATYQVPLLSWDEVQELQEGCTPPTLEAAARPLLLEAQQECQDVPGLQAE